MLPKVKTPRNFINPLLWRKSANPDDFEKFKKSLKEYRDKLTQQVASGQIESGIVTNALKPFLDSLGYTSESHSQKGQSGIDLAIKIEQKPAVIIEAKAPSREAKIPNSKEMITTNDFNKKALHEAVLYYMRELGSGNGGIFHIIITDFDNWFVFDGKDFDRLFWQNTEANKIYKEFLDPKYAGDRTKDFYDSLARLFSKQPDLISPENIKYAYFNLQNEASEDDLLALYKLFSKDCLLKKLVTIYNFTLCS